MVATDQLSAQHRTGAETCHHRQLQEVAHCQLQKLNQLPDQLSPEAIMAYGTAPVHVWSRRGPSHCPGAAVAVLEAYTVTGALPLLLAR